MCNKSNHLRFLKDSKMVVDSVLQATENNKRTHVFKQYRSHNGCNCEVNKIGILTLSHKSLSISTGK